MTNFLGIISFVFGAGITVWLGVRLFGRSSRDESDSGPKLQDAAELKELHEIHARMQRAADRAENAGDSRGAALARKRAAAVLLVPTLAAARAKEAGLQTELEQRLRVVDRMHDQDSGTRSSIFVSDNS
jgi:hypothetical protein